MQISIHAHQVLTDFFRIKSYSQAGLMKDFKGYLANTVVDLKKKKLTKTEKKERNLRTLYTFNTKNAIISFFGLLIYLS